MTASAELSEAVASGALQLTKRSGTLLHRILNASVHGYRTSARFAVLGALSFGGLACASSRMLRATGDATIETVQYKRLQMTTSLILAGVAGYAMWGFGYVLGFSRSFSASSTLPGAAARFKGGVFAVLMCSPPLVGLTCVVVC